MDKKQHKKPKADLSPLEEKYQKFIDMGSIRHDESQIFVLKKLASIYFLLEKARQKKLGHKKLIAKLAMKKPTPPIKGLYIYGEVGRGKSMLMDLFYSSVTTKRKIRVHFHAFMLGIHKNLYNLRNSKQHIQDPLVSVAKQIADNYTLLCFDEFSVSDITDAMILGRLFSYIFDLGVTVIATSNVPPDNLYQDGLQRESFLPFIEIVKSYTEVVELKSMYDYRLQYLKSLKTVYFYPLSKEADNFINSSFYQLTHNAKSSERILEVSGHKIIIGNVYGDIAMTSFSSLCEKPLGAADYIAISEQFSTLLLYNIPLMSKDQRNEAKRFVTLIDELYEHKVKLICSADAPPDKIYTEGTGSFEFKRTSSRLIEMQSDSYLGTIHNSK